ncbi:LysM peptidoglycan-binding domain-containing protein [Gammaproteobacteria bacterium AH-315-M22]|nr:LysM peptidoglycan-binding domain-containing protein [Gammaproteobacteria bacterium AH-315-M22]
MKKPYQVVIIGSMACLLYACTSNYSPLIEPQIAPENDANTKTIVNNTPAIAANTLITDGQIPNPLHRIVAKTAPAKKTIQPIPGWTDVWQRIPHGYGITFKDNQHIQAQQRSFTRNPAYLNRVSKRATPYLYYIVEEIERRNMPMELALLPIVESAYQPFAYSPSRAAGIWQFIPGTARHYGLKINWWYDGRRDTYAATDAALNYLQKLHDEFDDWLLALAAYNAGEGNVRKAIRRNRKQNKAIDFWSLPLPRETRHYVPRLLAVSQIIKQPDQFGITLQAIPNSPRFTRVDISSQIDLALVEQLAKVPLETIYRLNPGLNQWATDPNGPHHIVLPLNKAEQFTLALAAHPKEQRITWQRHKIRSGETLSHIADKYRTRVSVLKQANNLRSNTIRAGRELMIPVAVKTADRYVLSANQRRVRAQNSGSGYKVNYTVRRGDSLWKIANRYGVSISKLTRWNGLSRKSILKPGRKLVVWPHSKQAKQQHYTVRRGDSLDRISRRFKVSINDLVNWNSLDKNKHLKPGQKLKVTSNAG